MVLTVRSVLFHVSARSTMGDLFCELFTARPLLMIGLFDNRLVFLFRKIDNPVPFLRFLVIGSSNTRFLYIDIELITIQKAVQS